MIHFVKRELETLLYVFIFLPFHALILCIYSVHRFSHATMPIYNLFKK